MNSFTQKSILVLKELINLIGNRNIKVIDLTERETYEISSYHSDDAYVKKEIVISYELFVNKKGVR